MLDVPDRPDALAHLSGIHEQWNKNTIGPVTLPYAPGTVCECSEQDEPVGISAPGNFADEPEPELAFFAQNLAKGAVLIGDFRTLFRASLYPFDLFPALVLPAIEAPELFVKGNAFLGNVAVEIH